MPITPSQAIRSSGAAKLTEEDKAKRVDVEKFLDGFLAADWPGCPVTIGIKSVNTRVMALVVRAFVQKHWLVTAAPLDGILGKASDIIAAGGSPDWLLTLAPDWRADEAS